MRWVDRGPEPDGVAEYAKQFTQGWIDYFQSQIGGRPTDSHWRGFRPTLGNRTNNVCWYCERQCSLQTELGGRAPTVDHFRPISRFPQLAYEWSNWIFSCRRCNGENKMDKWRDSGYVDPAADVPAERPESYFDYDVQTGELIPKDGLSEAARRKALDTITDLGLNKLDVRFHRIDWTRGFVADLMLLPLTDRQTFAEAFIQRPVEYAGVTGMVVRNLRVNGHIQ